MKQLYFSRTGLSLLVTFLLIIETAQGEQVGNLIISPSNPTTVDLITFSVDVYACDLGPGSRLDAYLNGNVINISVYANVSPVGCGYPNYFILTDILPSRLTPGIYEVYYSYNGDNPYLYTTIVITDVKYGGGTGTPYDPYLIYDPCQMNEIGLHSEDWSKYFKLMADIDLGRYTGTQYNIIGTYSYKPFSGVFDGNGHTISNFIYDSNDIDYIGLFSYMSGEGAEIKNLGLINADVNAGTGQYVGALVGHTSRFSGDATWSIRNCYATGMVRGSNNVGGLVGNSGTGLTIQECNSQVNVTGINNIGGLIGYNGNDNLITGCYSTGSVTGEKHVGGFMGWSNYVTIEYSYTTCAVIGNENVGGFAGWSNQSTITQCYSAGTTSGNINVGGFAGQNWGTVITDCYWDIDTSSLMNMCGTGSCDDSYGRTTSEMMQQATFIGWDFVSEITNGTDNIWRMCIDEIDYPRLAWEFLLGDCTCPDGIALDDFSYFSSRFLETGCETKNNCGMTDANYDGFVNLEDFLYQCENWLAE